MVLRTSLMGLLLETVGCCTRSNLHHSQSLLQDNGGEGCLAKCTWIWCSFVLLFPFFMPTSYQMSLLNWERVWNCHIFEILFVVEKRD
jgi:hypothetical protein